MTQGVGRILAAAIAAACGAAGALSGSAFAESEVAAQPRPVVLELFVSQNCAACMNANRQLAQIAAERDVLPLTYDVDYWDYLGWRDTMAHPSFTQRQRDYADRFGQARVYTPQMIVDGRQAGPGGDGSRIEDDIKICREAAARAPRLSARREGGHIAIEIGAGAAPQEGADIWLVGYQPGQVTTEVGAGENRGQDFVVVNPVREVIFVGEWNGQADQMRVRAPDAAGFAVLVQHQDAGPVLAVASGR